VGGLISLPKNPTNAPLFSADVFTTSWLETNIDLNKTQRWQESTGFQVQIQSKIDNDGDNFTDVTLSDRIFSKWTFDRKENRLFTIAARGVYEDRLVAMRWEKNVAGNLWRKHLYQTSRINGKLHNCRFRKTDAVFSGNVHFKTADGYDELLANQKLWF
jgi:outer membrane receptor for ferrienterochelin and colicins